MDVSVNARPHNKAETDDEPHGGWKGYKVAYPRLKSGSQLIRGIGPRSRRPQGSSATASDG